jgi:hypothetical protein
LSEIFSLVMDFGTKLLKSDYENFQLECQAYVSSMQASLEDYEHLLNSEYRQFSREMIQEQRSFDEEPREIDMDFENWSCVEFEEYLTRNRLSYIKHHEWDRSVTVNRMADKQRAVPRCSSTATLINGSGF